MIRPAASLLVLLACAAPAFALEVSKDLAAARQLLASGKSEAARTALAALVEQAPNDVDVALAYAEAQVAMGEFDGAVTTLSRTIDLAPKRADVVLALGRTLLLQARAAAAAEDYESAGYAFTDARRFLEQAADLDPERAAPLLLAAAAAAENGDPDAALALTERAVEREPKSVEAQLDAGARRYFAAAALIESDPDGAKAMREKCREAYRAALAIDPANGNAWNGLGWAAKQANELDEAAASFTKALEVDPTHDNSYRQLSLLLANDKEQRTKLEATLDKIVIKSKTFGKDDVRKFAQGLAYYYRGKARGQLRDLAGLDSDMKEAANVWPSLTHAGALAAGLALTATGDYSGAAKRLTGFTVTALDQLAAAVLSDLDPRQSLLTLRGLADQLVKLNSLDEAREIFKLVATAQNNSADDWNNYAFFCRETGKYEESYTAYSRALELNPNDPGVLNDTALILQYHLLRDLEYALELYGRAETEAQRILDDPAIDSRTADATKIALRDARNNGRMLKEALERGDTSAPKDPGNNPPPAGNGGGKN